MKVNLLLPAERFGFFLSQGKTIIILLLYFISAGAAYAQQNTTERKISGTIVDETGSAMPGVSILISGTSTGTRSDADGKYELIVPADRDVLHVTFIGYKNVDITVGSQTIINVTMTPDIQSLEEVVVVGYGVQKKQSVVSAVTSVSPETLKSPTGNLTNSIAGRVAGIIAYQTSGEPGLGTDNSAFFIRGLSSFGSGKVNPLILIDNIESTATDLARLQTDDIASFSVLKDASAAAVYGSRGANGVILVTTKLGIPGKARYNFRVENTISTNTRNYQLTDNISYMRDANEATLTRNPASALPYGENKINHTLAGDDPYLYPNNNWIDKMIKDYTANQRYNLNISGGSENSSYYIAGTYNVDNGVLKIDPINDFNSNIKLRNYSIRSNITVNFTKTTEFVLRLYGQFDDYRGPVGGGAIAFRNALAANPVMFPAVYPKSKLPYINHPLFGSVPTQGSGSLTGGLFLNPYAEMVRGYQVYKTSNINPQIELRQNLDFLTEGLSASVMTYLQRYSFFSVARAYNPFYYTANIDPIDPSQYTLSVLNNGAQGSAFQPTGTEYLGYAEFPKEITSKMYLQGSINYARTFNNKHEVSGLLTGFISSFEAGNSGSVVASLPQRNTVLAGRVTYGYNSKYLAEFNFGYNGSERFSEKNRFGFFPSIGVAYNISNESFFEPLKNKVSELKLRFSYGLVGNDQIGNVNDRFFYLSDVSANDNNFGASFGTGIGTALYSRPGYRINRYGNNNIAWEVSRQLNLGVDVTLFNSLSIIANAFKTKRSNIYFPNPNIESAQGLTSVPSANYGSGETKGIDLSLDYTNMVSSDLSLTISGTFTYATSKVLKNEQIQYGSDLAHLSKKGYSFSQSWGFIAERLFIDDEEVENSPDQSFFGSEVRGGDIKYRDINGDKVINNDDVVPIGYPTQPEIVYGIGPSITYKRFDFGFMFQGAARSTFFIDPLKTSPFIQFGGYDQYGNIVLGTGFQNGELEAIHQDHWSEENPNPYAFWPRLSNQIEWNNVQRSTWWMRNGSFIRLKTVTLGYTFQPIKKLFDLQPRIYFSANNLFAMSSFKLWDVEMGGNGLGYPVQRVYMVGLQLDF
ncbi:SusC/RagA family TonB-linked outer membrane protein [Ohtaekwangia kribbensis]|jgi:TonB-linked SusC/RagA family outer membrane protein|uniref:SusC/RagA family TonB-linked outer membrane protein n=1 Tax=Ohtaekwangia kribbensis TaxID=688913 RepID=A0ABW3K5M8_9BACT